MNFDSPESMDESLLVAQMRQLASGLSIDKPVYDFARHTPSGSVDHVPAADYVVVEGLFTLYWPEVRSLLHASVYIAASHEVCLERRLERDVRDRERTPEYVMAQYCDTVRPMCDRYILPTEKHAGLMLTGTNFLDRPVHCIIALIRSNQTWAPARRGDPLCLPTCEQQAYRREPPITIRRMYQNSSATEANRAREAATYWLVL